ncbi:MAG: spore maturation protein [Bergeyella sp.]|nr:spore maturation protein [Bergeyella sp.]
MILSRIWSGFIIISVFVACVKYLGSERYNSIFSDMVIGKRGDTITLKKLPLSSPNNIKKKEFHQDKKFYQGKKIEYKTDLRKKEITIYEIQKADGIIKTAEFSVKICLNLIAVMALFMGFMSIAEKAGGVRFLSRLIQPFFSKLFPEIPKGHPSFGHMFMNFSANLLGLDNAATPFGLKAMESLQSINTKKDTASNSQIMFLCLHAGGMTLIPVSIIAIRSSMGSQFPTDIFLPCILSTFCATMAAMVIVCLYQRINILQPVLLLYILGISSIVGSLSFFLVRLSREELGEVSKLLSNGLILFIFTAIIMGGIYKKIDVFDSFIEGAKEGFGTCIKIIPYLVGILVSISLLRTSGVFEFLIDGMKFSAEKLSLDPRFVDGLPTALIKPLSGSGARGMMIDTLSLYGADSFQGKLSAILQGSSDTTFYIIAIYFGSVSIKNTRYTVTAMLIADLVGIITSVLLAYSFFG